MAKNFRHVKAETHVSAGFRNSLTTSSPDILCRFGWTHVVFPTFNSITTSGAIPVTVWSHNRGRRVQRLSKAVTMWQLLNRHTSLDGGENGKVSIDAARIENKRSATLLAIDEDACVSRHSGPAIALAWAVDVVILECFNRAVCRTIRQSSIASPPPTPAVCDMRRWIQRIYCPQV